MVNVVEVGVICGGDGGAFSSASDSEGASVGLSEARAASKAGNGGVRASGVESSVVSASGALEDSFVSLTVVAVGSLSAVAATEVEDWSSGALDGMASLEAAPGAAMCVDGADGESDICFWRRSVLFGRG